MSTRTRRHKQARKQHSASPPDPQITKPSSTSPQQASLPNPASMFGPILLTLPRSISGGHRSGSVSGDCSSQSRARIYGPSSLEDEFLMDKVKGWTKPVLAKIDKIYSRLELDKELLDKGFCFGLLDPASNIIINNAISKRASALKSSIDGGGGEQAGDMNQRSLNGLIAFLTYLFPYLPEAEAVRYLDAADADPLVAALIIINGRGIQQHFGFNSGTTVAAVVSALKCAAIAAKHPDPEQLVLGWKLLSVSPDIRKFSYMPPSTGALVFRVQTAMEVAGISDANLQLRESWELARCRRLKKPIGNDLPPVRAAMKRMLLTMIHGFYLEALARLPRPEMRNQYHRSMLMGGYCYGPLDPVSNIIVNTLWYEQAFPRSESDEVTLHMISCNGLWRAVARSLYGLVSFLCTRYPRLTPEQAMKLLLETGANLQAADPNLIPMLDTTRRDNKLSWSGSFAAGRGTPHTYEVTKRSVRGSSPSVGVAEAYAAAATAAHHPNPVAQKEFLGSPDMVRKLKDVSDVLNLQDSDRAISFDSIKILSLFVKCPSMGESYQQQEPTWVSKSEYNSISENCESFWEKDERVCTMVEDALDTYNKGRVNPYKFHFICGVNELVSGPEFNKDEVGGYNPWTAFKYHHSHINFLAICEDDGAGAPATLFFAECGNNGAGGGWCLPVNPHSDADQVRCIYCENEKIRIVHPTMKSFNGRNVEFEKVIRGEPLFHADKLAYNNDRLIIHYKVMVDWVYPLDDDDIYSLGYNNDADGGEEEDSLCDEIC